MSASHKYKSKTSKPIEGLSSVEALDKAATDLTKALESLKEEIKQKDLSKKEITPKNPDKTNLPEFKNLLEVLNYYSFSGGDPEASIKVKEGFKF